MKRARTFICVPVLILQANLLRADPKPNFSGAWKLNTFDSDFGMLPAPASRSDLIEHNEPNLKVTTAVEGAQGPQSNVAYYKTDGKNSTNEIGELLTKSTVSWQGDSLLIKSVLYVDDTTVKVTSVLTLSADGCVLTQTSHLSLATGEMDQKLIFENSERHSPASNAAATINYSGTWKLEIAKSSFGSLPKPDARVDVIDHQEPILRITTSQDNSEGRQESTMILSTDGQAGRGNFAGLPAKTSASWVGKNLVVRTKLNSQDDVTVQTIYILSADGTILTQRSHIKTPAAVSEQQLIFEKQ